MTKNKTIIADTALLLTASIDPCNMPDAIHDPEKRLADYIEVLSYYVKHDSGIRKIVFADNSGWPIDDVSRAIRDNPYKKDIEYISLSQNDFPREFGKGYGEHNLIATALHTSKILRETPYCAKMTGRHYLFNITEILEKTYEPIGMLCDFRDHPFFDLLRLPYCGHHCDTRFIVFRPGFFDRYLRDITNSHRTGGFSMEAQYYHALKDLEDGNQVKCRFPVEPVYGGIAGHWGKNYSGTAEEIKRKIRSVSRRLFPRLRI